MSVKIVFCISLSLFFLTFQYHQVFMALMNLLNLQSLKGISSVCYVSQVVFHPRISFGRRKVSFHPVTFIKLNIVLDEFTFYLTNMLISEDLHTKILGSIIKYSVCNLAGMAQ